jgi:uncharacterized protein involved in response to NO
LARATRIIDPYRLLFPIGVTYGAIGAGLWPLYALHGVAYPGTAHRLLMIQGFEQSFVSGFLLTAMPGLTKGPPCGRVELAIAIAAAVGFGVAVLAGAPRFAEAAFAASLLLLLVAIARRLKASTAPKAAELMFVGLGLVLGLTGALMQIVAGEVRPFPGRMISLGMVLSLVLGLGGLLVPTFTGMRAPLEIPGVARPHERAGRVLFYLGLMAALVGAFVLEAAGQPRLGALLRASAATVVITMVWKLVRPPGRRDVPALTMWSSGWLILAGLWTVVVAPAITIGALHVVFIGGFTLLTLGIGTRVVVAHGRHPLADERRVLAPAVPLLVLAALVTRLAAEWAPAQAPALLAVAGTSWVAGWLWWARGAAPRIVRTAAGPNA